jgi:aminoglycoside phosphotransferase family enzyme/predicted kinase
LTTIPPEQREVANFLTRLAGRPPTETHISAVFVGRDEVWKLKKAVLLPFLDFRTAEARHHFLERELALNQPVAPAIYRRVASVDRGPDGTLRIAPSPDTATAIDWVLCMAPIPRSDFLDIVAQRQGLSPTLLDALGDCVAEDHARRPPVFGWDSEGALRRVAEGCVRSALAVDLPATNVHYWMRSVHARFEHNAVWLAARAAAGFVRRCHGDLHLGNLCLWQGVPTPFDALEFDEALATIDVGYDLAFLLMDIDLNVGRAEANRVLNRAIARSGDAALARALPMFMSLRAMVRAHVEEALRRDGSGRRYLTAAIDYLKPARAFVVAIGGPPATGKSTLARRLAPRLGRAPGAVIIRSDEIRKRLFGVAPEQRLPQTAYTPTVTFSVYLDLGGASRMVAAGGHAVIADATFMHIEHRAEIEAAARAADVTFIGVWLTAPPALLEARIRERRHDASDADLGVLHAALARDPGAIGWHAVDTTNADDAAAAVSAIIDRELGTTAAAPPR